MYLEASSIQKVKKAGSCEKLIVSTSLHGVKTSWDSAKKLIPDKDELSAVEL